MLFVLFFVGALEERGLFEGVCLQRCSQETGDAVHLIAMRGSNMAVS